MGKYDFTPERLEKIRRAAFKATGPRDKVHNERNGKPSIFERYLVLLRDPMTLVLLVTELIEARRRIEVLELQVEEMKATLKVLGEVEE